MKLRILIASLLAAGASAAVVTAAQNRVLDAEINASQLTKVMLVSGVGDVIVAGAEGDIVRVEAILRPRRGGFFSSLKAAEKQVQQATLETTISGTVLTVKVTGDDDRRFEEDWAIVLPPALFFELEHGVGELSISGVRGGVQIEAGVSEVNLSIQEGDIDVEVGVGNIVIRAPSAAYQSVEASSGVGDTLIQAEGARITGQGFVGHAAEWEGGGRHDIDAATGVGDIRIILE